MTEHNHPPAIEGHYQRQEDVRIRRRGTALVTTDDGFLLIQEKPGGRWWFPGGGTENGESSMCAAIRELKEETGLKAKSVEFLFGVWGPVIQTLRGRRQQLFQVFRINVYEFSRARAREHGKSIKFYNGDMNDKSLHPTTRDILREYEALMEQTKY